MSKVGEYYREMAEDNNWDDCYDDIVTNCCNAYFMDETDICSKCYEHADVDNEMLTKKGDK